jgi:hypothetical protein
MQPAVMNKAVVPTPASKSSRPRQKCKDELKHSRLRIATAETNFRQRVRIETSDDNRFWAVAREDGYIFDFTQGDKKLSALTVDYPVSTGRYVRATIFGWTTTGAIAEVWSAYRLEQPAQRYIVDGVTPERTEDPATRTSLLTLDLSQPGLPSDRVRLEVGGPISTARWSWKGERCQDLAHGGAGHDLSGLATSNRSPFPIGGAVHSLSPAANFQRDNRPVPVVRVYVRDAERQMKFLRPRQVISISTTATRMHSRLCMTSLRS